jgi:lipopolysaccharide cholinephosphotransferase
MAGTLKKTSKEAISTLYQLVYDVHRIFEKNNIPYWIIAGTALGAIRHGGIIPWDDDADIGIDKRDIKKILAIKDILKKCGLGLTRAFIGYKIYYTDRPAMKGVKYSFPNLDIFPFERHGQKLRYSREAARYTWPKEYFYEEEVFPLRKYKFGNYEVWGAYNYKNYFSRAYGKKWFVEAYREYDHEEETYVDKIKVKMTDKDRKPALPLKVRNRKCVDKIKRKL